MNDMFGIDRIAFHNDRSANRSQTVGPLARKTVYCANSNLAHSGWFCRTGEASRRKRLVLGGWAGGGLMLRGRLPAFEPSARAGGLVFWGWYWGTIPKKCGTLTQAFQCWYAT